MPQDTEHQPEAPAEVGTPEGRERARQLLDAGRARITDADWDELQERFGRRDRQVA